MSKIFTKGGPRKTKFSKIIERNYVIICMYTSIDFASTFHSIVPIPLIQIRCLNEP